MTKVEESGMPTADTSGPTSKLVRSVSNASSTVEALEL